MKYVLEIQSGAQHLYNCINSAIEYEIIDMHYNNLGKIVHIGSSDHYKSDTCEILYKCYIDRLYDEFLVYSSHHHRFGECIDMVSDIQLNTIDCNGFCSGCNQHISDTIKEEFLNHHELYEIGRDIGDISIHEYIPGSTTCRLVIELDNPYLFNVLCDDLMNTFLTVIIYHLDDDTIYKSTITSVPIVYTVLPNLTLWKFNNEINDIATRLVKDKGDEILHEIEILSILKPEYKTELYTFVNRYLDAVYIIQNTWRKSRYNPDGNLCKKWCAEIQAKWNKNKW